MRVGCLFAQPAPTSTAPTQTTNTTAPARAAPAPTRDDDRGLKTTQIIIAIVGSLVGIIVGLVTIWLAVRKGARATVFAMLDSTEGRKALADCVLTHFARDPGRKEFREFTLDLLASNDSEEQMRKLVTKLVVQRDESKDKVQHHVDTLLEEIEKQMQIRLNTQEIALRMAQLERSKFGRYAGDPLAYEDEIKAQVTKLAASVGILPPPKEEPSGQPEKGRKNPPENTPKADDGD